MVPKFDNSVFESWGSLKIKPVVTCASDPLFNLHMLYVADSM